MTKWIAYRFWNETSGPAYVANLKGDGGVDWGYTNKEADALPLTEYQWKQFARDVAACKSQAYCIPAK